MMWKQRENWEKCEMWYEGTKNGIGRKISSCRPALTKLH